MNYLISIRATSPVVFACASIEADACTKTLYFANLVLSEAISTSTMRPLAASIFVLVVDMLSDANRSLDIDAPLSAHSVAMFCSACVKTPTETAFSLIVSPILSAANAMTSPEVPPVVPAE